MPFMIRGKPSRPPASQNDGVASHPMTAAPMARQKRLFVLLVPAC
jgi:hypothetical protein